MAFATFLHGSMGSIIFRMNLVSFPFTQEPLLRGASALTFPVFDVNIAFGRRIMWLWANMADSAVRCPLFSA